MAATGAVLSEFLEYDISFLNARSEAWKTYGEFLGLSAEGLSPV